MPQLNINRDFQDWRGEWEFLQFTSRAAALQAYSGPERRSKPPHSAEAVFCPGETFMVRMVDVNSIDRPKSSVRRNAGR
ncbi:MAG: hypothetical protein ABSE62_11480 [Chthoniobacteraceae bacterium]